MFKSGTCHAVGQENVPAELNGVHYAAQVEHKLNTVVVVCKEIIAALAANPCVTVHKWKQDLQTCMKDEG